ncbi:hypothetical protein PM082_020978 [Marasmius tenuissimus]|nr:hypothetical protein PM082_020978 [Marasmius tenuissimus]
MPKAKFTPKAPIEKLPLAVRKDLRDSYEVQKEDWEKTISDLLGVSFKLNMNANEVWAYNTDSNNTGAGRLLAGYVEGFIYCLKRFVETYEDEGKAHFNAAIAESELKLGVDPLGDDAPYIGCTVKDGSLWILFQHTSLGSNQNYVYDALLAAIEAAPREGLSLRAKHSIAESWEEKIDDLKEQLVAVTGISDLILEPHFEENYKALKGSQSDDRWEESFGRATFDYFENFKDNLIRQGFKGDDMLQEGLQDSVTSKKFLLQVVPKIKAYYNEVIVEDGAACIQTTPENWWTNVSQTGEGFINLL